MIKKQPTKICLDHLRHISEQQFDIRIAADGRWFHDGDAIGRIELVKLFASILIRDEFGKYWLVTPVEKGRIEVDDVPFIVVDVSVEVCEVKKSNKIEAVDFIFKFSGFNITRFLTLYKKLIITICDFVIPCLFR